MLGVDIGLGIALEAITKDSDNTHESDAEPIAKRRGMAGNYERLEFLGGESIQKCNIPPKTT